MVLWNFDLPWKNYCTLEKSMELWTTLWFYGKNNGTISKTMKFRKFRFMKGKTWRITKNCETLIYNR